jgi:hypothetical protein
MKEKEQINFKPINEGLGFKPFADGMPYAPAGKTLPKEIRPHAAPATQAARILPHAPEHLRPGTGAVAAGMPRYAIPAQAPIHTTSTLQPKASPMRAPVVAEAHFGFTYVIKRVFAFLGDSILHMGAVWLALSAALQNQGISQSVLEDPTQLIFVFGFLMLFNWAIMTALEVAFGTTVFKRVFGLALQGTASAIFLRAFFFVPGVAFFGAGLLWCLFNPRRRCWHDTVVDLAPIESARL